METNNAKFNIRLGIAALVFNFCLGLFLGMGIGNEQARKDGVRLQELSDNLIQQINKLEACITNENKN